MTIYAIVKLNSFESKIIHEDFFLEEFSIFTRGTIKNIIRAMSIELNQRTRESRMVEVNEKLNNSVEIKIFTKISDIYRVVVVADKGYKSMIGQKLVLRAFKSNNYKELIKQYQNWEEQDIIKQIEDELQKCNAVVVDGLSKIMERGESLSELVDKSENLSSQTKLLFKTAKKKNRCC